MKIDVPEIVEFRDGQNYYFKIASSLWVPCTCGSLVIQYIYASSDKQEE